LPCGWSSAAPTAGDWHPGPAHTALTRPAWWQAQETDWPGTWLPVAVEARGHSAVAFLDITKAALIGALNSVASGYRTMRYQELVVAGGTFYVIESKSNAKDNHPVYKSSAEQLSNAMDWFTAEYTTVARAVPVLVHPRAQFERQAAVPHGCQVVTTQKLTFLRDALRKLATELAADDAFRDSDRVGRLLAAHRLTTDAFLSAYAQRAIPGQ
jgi:hypothetical protein